MHGIPYMIPANPIHPSGSEEFMASNPVYPKEADPCKTCMHGSQDLKDGIIFHSFDIERKPAGGSSLGKKSERKLSQTINGRCIRD